MVDTNMRVGFAQGRKGTYGIHGLHGSNKKLQDRTQAQAEQTNRTKGSPILTKEELKEEITAIKSGLTVSF